jgi:hypothetical protein
VAARLPTLHVAGFSASVDAFAWEADPGADPALHRMRLWFVSLLGPQEGVRALWARLVRGETATLSPEPPANARFCVLAAEGGLHWRFHAARLPAAAGAHGVLLPDAALYATERRDFLLLAREPRELPRHHFRFLNRRVDVPLHPAWTGWLWQRAVGAREAVPLDGIGLCAYRCVPDARALAADLRRAIRSGGLPAAEAPGRAAAPDPAR